MQMTQPYSIKHVGPDKARIYIALNSLLSVAGMKAGTRVTAEYRNNQVVVRKAKAGEESFAVLSTSRGAILEIRNSKLKMSMGRVGQALVSASDRGITIIPHPTELKRLEREDRFKRRVQAGNALRGGSLYSGIGLLPYHLHEGLQAGGVKVKMALASDINPKSLDVSMRCNPIWNDADRSAKVVCGDLRHIMDTTTLPQLDILDISYPCNGQSTLASKENRDTHHPLVGDLFIDTVGVIRATSPALIIMECTPAFNNSDTLRLIEKSLPDYNWHHFVLQGGQHGSLENRARACVVAISKGLSHLLSSLTSIQPQARRQAKLGNYLEDIALDSPLWKEYKHVVGKLDDDRLDFKHYLHTAEDTRIATIVSTYQSPKIGSPFVAHPTNPKLMRLLTPLEHARIKGVPDSILKEIQAIVSGDSPIVTQRGSNTLAHQLLGLSVDRWPWVDVGRNVADALLQSSFDDLLLEAA